MGAWIENPSSLLLVWIPSFELVCRTDTPPVIRIAGRDAQTGRLPGARRHRRHLIKYAAPVLATEVSRAQEGPISSAFALTHSECWEARRVSIISAQDNGYEALLVLDPGLPDIRGLESSEESGAGTSRSTVRA